LTVTRTGDLSNTSTVNWTTVAGTALAGSDFASTAGSLSFSSGETTKTIVISIAADKKSEATEQFTVVLSNPSVGTTIGTGTGTVTIQDNDGALLATAAGASGSVQPLLASDAVDLLAVVVLRWLDAGASADRLAGLTIRVADLPGTKLADTLGRTITLDIDAAGWGWALSPMALTADRMDLASVLTHELGHVLGLEHGTGVMSELLAPGESLPAPEAALIVTSSANSFEAVTTAIVVHDPMRASALVVVLRLAPAAAALDRVDVILPVARELLLRPSRSLTEPAAQLVLRVSPSQQHEPLTVVLLGLALAAMIRRRRAALVASN
jgi:MYXO-CTERM domain-containing protein